jgi:branched-chain amino acid aminotransferase
MWEVMFQEGLAPIHLKVEETYHRAAPGGTGSVKTVGNYASVSIINRRFINGCYHVRFVNYLHMLLLGDLRQVLKTQRAAKAEGFSDVLYLDAVENKYVEEVSSCNIFVVKVWFFLLT